MTSLATTAKATAYSPAVISIFRIIVGLMFAIHGSSKVLGWPFGQAIPAGQWPGWWAGIIELVTGLLVAAGLFTRPAALIASGEMAVAYFWQHVIDPPPMITRSFWPHVNSGEPAVIYCFAFLLLAFIGPGAYAVETMRRRRVVSGTAAPPGARGGLFRRRGPIADRAAAVPGRRPSVLDRFRRR